MVTNSVPPATPSWCPLIRREIGPKAADAALLLVTQTSQNLRSDVNRTNVQVSPHH
jgi:hypothetical protein